ncbi:hypothetical protein, partial [Butyricimonas faecihominis]|uniref:hypothetical protein n=1 Tax=Butyricimonas faecihominis TaxID=1472416 RepID=UPI0032C05B1A
KISALQLFFFKDTRFFVLLNSAKVNVQKVIFQTPSRLRRTPSINRGRAEILTVDSLFSVYRGEGT